MREPPLPPTFFCKSIIPGELLPEFDNSVILGELPSYVDKSIILLHLTKVPEGTPLVANRTGK